MVIGKVWKLVIGVSALADCVPTRFRVLREVCQARFGDKNTVGRCGYSSLELDHLTYFGGELAQVLCIRLRDSGDPLRA
jgi:hypothetical protein